MRNPLYCHSLALCVFLLFWFLPVFPGFTLSLALWTLFAPHLDYCCLPGLSLFALPLLDIVRRSSTHACPKDYSVSCPCHTCLLFIDPACIMTMFWNKALHMDPHVSRLVRPVTTDFIKEFADFLSEIVLAADKVLIVGDFNIHVDNEKRCIRISIHRHSELYWG